MPHAAAIRYAAAAGRWGGQAAEGDLPYLSFPYTRTEEQLELSRFSRRRESLDIHIHIQTSRHLHHHLSSSLAAAVVMSVAAAV